MGTNPIDVRIIPPDLSGSDIARMAVIGTLSLVPVVLAIIMQKASLRQAIVMHASHYGGEVCSGLAEFFGDRAAVCKTVYNVARM
jgi:hypothetical protein